MNFDTLISEFTFPLPEERIARYPADRRDQAKLLLIDRTTGQIQDRQIHELPEILKPDDLLVRNTTRVSWRRVLLSRTSGSQMPGLFLEAPDPDRPHHWKVLIKRTRRVAEGELLPGPDPTDPIRFRFFRSTGNTPEARVEVVTPSPSGDGTFVPAWKSLDEAEEFFEKAGMVPLPPYLKRESEELDRIRYQTVYAGRPGSVAAPTAGLHFTPELLQRLDHRKVRFADLELRIGYGTFAPLKEEQYLAKELHEESYTLDQYTADLLNQPLRKISVGTTSLRALEDNRRKGEGKFIPGEFTTRIFLHPPHTTGAADGLLTNFHLPGSSLILLVAAFLGSENTLRAYKHALDNDYRFFSYGDAMLIL